MIRCRTTVAHGRGGGIGDAIGGAEDDSGSEEEEEEDIFLVLLLLLWSLVVLVSVPIATGREVMRD